MSIILQRDRKRLSSLPIVILPYGKHASRGLHRLRRLQTGLLDTLPDFVIVVNFDSNYTC